MDSVPITQTAPTEAPKTGIDIGTVNIAIDSSSVDSFIARLERALAAFKAEWIKGVESDVWLKGHKE